MSLPPPTDSHPFNNAGGFHQRKPSLTTACPPTGAPSRHPFFLHSSSTSFPVFQWFRRLLRLRIVRVLGWTYILVSFVLSSIHLLTFLSSPSIKATALVQDVNRHAVAAASTETVQQVTSSSPLNSISDQLRLSKMFSKSLVRMDHIRPFWFTASWSVSEKKNKDLTVATILTLDEWPHLIKLANMWQGPISAALQLEGGGFDSGTVMEQLSRIQRSFESEPMLRQHVDLHLLLRPSSRNIHGGYQESRNLARLFSRTEFVVHMPVTALYMTDLEAAVRKYGDRLRRGDALVVPTFGFPRTNRAVLFDSWPTTKEEMVAWSDEARIGMLDYHWRLNEGPTSYVTWRQATEPYLVPTYDYHYSPVYIATREGHPWCEERFADEASSCIYSIYLSGADLWVLPNDFIVRTGQEPENKLTAEERRMQLQLYKNFRIEQCVFYARQFDQQGLFETERAKHVQQECAKSLGDLKKEKMIGQQ